MNYGYIRVSSEKQTVENQRFEITKFCEKNNIKIDEWIAETVSGTKGYKQRQLGRLLKRVSKGDRIVCSEISRLGRSLYMIMDILNLCMEHECVVMTVKDGFRLGDDIQSKVLAFAFGLSAEIERQLISQRTREALSRKRSEGKHLGRPFGSTTSVQALKIYDKREIVMHMYASGRSIYAIAKKLKVHPSTVKHLLEKLGTTLSL